MLAVSLCKNRSADVYVLAGHGYSCVPKVAKAAWQYLYALEQEAAELEMERSDQSVLSDMTDIRLPEISISQEGTDEEGELEEAVDEHPWAPSAELLARQPDVLRIPFQLHGRLHISASRVVLCKLHTFGHSNELVYEGTVAVSEQPGTPLLLTLNMRCTYADAVASLTLAL
jgi:hypothetical protein